MSCVHCGGRQLTTKKENHRYTESGLSNVILMNVEIRHCEDCGDNVLIIPKPARLHKLIANDIAKQPEKLLGEQIRFLRTHLGWSRADFAAIFDVSRETVSRWENGQQMGALSERLLRLRVLHMEPMNDDYWLREVASKEPSNRSLRILLKNRDWELAPAA